MLKSFKRLFLHVKEEFSVKTYFALTLILWIVTIFRPSFPVREVYNSAFQYQYGIIGSWITFYLPKDGGPITLWNQFLHPGMGISFTPSVIFWDSLLIYLGYILLVFLIHGFPKRSL